MDNEVWKPIPGHEGYEASSMGRLRSARKVLVVTKINSGYLKASLGSKAQGLVHRFVAKAFLGECPKGHCVAHKNGNKTDNRIDNLMYATREANMMHCRYEGSDPCPLLRIENGKPFYKESPAQRLVAARGMNHGNCKTDEATVLMVHKLNSDGLLRSEIAKQLGRPYAWVSGILAGRRWSHLHPIQSKVRLRIPNPS